MSAVFVVAAVRTPIGSINGSLADFSAPQLGSHALERSNVPADDVDEVLFGNVLSANVGQNPARQAALGAGLPNKVPCTTINKVCATAVMLGAANIISGCADVIVAGGMESMSNVPYYLPKHRTGSKFGHSECLDGIVRDGLWDVYNSFLMGNAAELCAKNHSISRQEQDDYTASSYERAQKATANGSFKEEIVSLEVVSRGKVVTVVDKDEEVDKLNLDKLRTVRPVFEANGTVTAPNSSTLSDGASALILVSEKYLASHPSLKPLAVLKGWADAAQEPEKFTTAPSLAVPRALDKSGYTIQEIDLFEINEAFAVVSLANMRLLGLDASKVNIHGGAVSLGHPLGCSGARILVTLIHALHKEKLVKGVASVCNGGGGASAVVLEAVYSSSKL